MTYGTETWLRTKQPESELRSAQRDIESITSGTTLRDRKRATLFPEQSGVDYTNEENGMDFVWPRCEKS